MSEQEMVVAIIAGTIFTGAIFGKIIDLIKTWINRKNTNINEEEFDRLAQAFIKYKKITEQRIQHLESVIADDNADVENLADPSERTTIEERDKRDSKTNDNLRNMLRE